MLLLVKADFFQSKLYQEHYGLSPNCLQSLSAYEKKDSARKKLGQLK